MVVKNAIRNRYPLPPFGLPVTISRIAWLHLDEEQRFFPVDSPPPPREASPSPRRPQPSLVVAPPPSSPLDPYKIAQAWHARAAAKLAAKRERDGECVECGIALPCPLCSCKLHDRLVMRADAALCKLKFVYGSAGTSPIMGLWGARE